MESKQTILKLYKIRGETPLECILRFKKNYPEYEKDKMTYAGRLDPLAEGLLLVLVGEECKNKEKYLGLDKTYEVDVLFGFATDTYDVLGKVTKSANDFVIPVKTGIQADSNSINLDSRLCGNDTIRDVILSFIGKFSQKYPPFSSKTIKGKSLFSLFKSGELKDEEIPEKEVEIKDIKITGGRTISKADLEKYIIESVNLVKGDFRQEEILAIWKNVLGGVIPVQTGIQSLDHKYFSAEKSLDPDSFAYAQSVFEVGSQSQLQPRLRGDDKSTCHFMIVSLKVDCTSGTYMRSLANSIGEKVGIPALALNIKRIKLGDYIISN